MSTQRKQVLIIAYGNRLRGDDGVGPAIGDIVATWQMLDVSVLIVQQLTPECAEEIAGFDRVIFLDADAASTRLSIEAVQATTARSALTHASTPAEVVALSKALFGFLGSA